MKKKRPTRKRNGIAKALRTPKYKMQVQKDRKRKLLKREMIKSLANGGDAIFTGVE